MKYTIVVDKQSSSNPSEEKREYTIDIEELRTYKGVSDTLTVSSTTYVTRKLQLSEYGVLSILPTPQIEEVKDVDIILFEGENYIYILNEQGNKISASYLIKNDLTDTFPSKVEMATSIAQSAGQVEISVDQKLENYSTTEETKALIKVESDEINLELSKKANDEDLTGANLALRINEDDSSEAVINADSININGVISANGNFGVDTEGNMTCNNATVIGGKITLQAEGQSSATFRITSTSNSDDPREFFTTSEYMWLGAFQKSIKLDTMQTNPYIQLTDRSYNSTTVASNQITTPKLTQTSLESIKKNINKFTKNATDIINNSDIYEYNLKSDADEDKKLIGFIIGENYKIPDEVVSKDGQAVELYSAIGILWKSVQELSIRVKQLEKEVQHD